MSKPSLRIGSLGITAITAEDSSHPPRLRASAGTSPRFRFSAFPLSAFSSPAIRHAPPVPDRRVPPAFTLIELLVVVAVIGILAALTLAAMSGVQEKSTRDRVRTEIAAISNALERYRNIHDSYPPTGAANLYTNIAAFFETHSSQTNELGRLVDPYGNPYQYTAPGVRNPASFDLWSNGKSPNTNDDIGNW
jgi:general secretion pathway protein G